MNPEMTIPEEATPPTNAVSLYGQAGGPNDFPVLKAFQQYIDAEQAKARKRMLGLSVFFILLLIVIVITFTLVVMSVINRNQTLSDRLLDIALREKSPAQPVVTVQSPPPAPVVQPVVQPSVESAELGRLREELQRQKEERLAEQAKRDREKIDSLTAALAKAQQQPVAPAPVVVNTTPSPIVQPAAESAELVRLREELRREKEERKAEQAKAKEEKRQAEIEAHRRRLYPEYYARQDALKEHPAPLPQSASQPVPDMQPEPEPEPVTPPTPKPATAPKKNVAQPPSGFRNLPDKDPELAELLKNLKPAPTQTAPQPKPQAVPAPKAMPPPVVKATPPSAPKHVAQPAVVQPVAKPLPPPAAKPTPQPVHKPVAQPVAKPAAPPPPAQISAPPAQQTETLAIGEGDGNSIPWLIESPQN